MKKFRKLSHLLEQIEDDGINPEDVVVDPKAVHIVTDDDFDETENED